jgi:uncharacterized protein
MTQLSADWIARLGAPYMPGTGHEPPRVHFEDIKLTIPNRVDADALQSSPALDFARQLYTARYFWEAHEVLDALARAALPNGKPHHMLHGLMNLASACLKVRQRQPNAAARHVREAERLLAAAHGLEVPLDLDGLKDQCEGFRTAIQTGDVGDALAERPSLNGWTATRV